MALSVYSQVPIVDANGDPYVDAYLYFGIPNLDPVANPKTVYDQDGNIIANPVRTNVNGLTTLPVDLDGEYSLIIKNSASVQILSIPEGVYGIGAGGGGGSSTNYWEAVTDSGTGTTVIRIDKGQASYVVLDYTDVLIGTNTSNIPLFQNKGGSTWAINENFIISVSSSVAEPFDVRTSYNGQVFNDLVTSGASATNYLRMITKGNNASNISMLYNDGAGQAFNISADPVSGVTFQSSSTFYSVNAAREHFFYATNTAAIYQFNNGTGGRMTLHPRDAGGESFINTNSNNFAIGAQLAVNFFTDSGGYKKHYEVNSSGYHYADGAGYSGHIDKVVHVRGCVYSDGGDPAGGTTGLTILAGGHQVTCDRTATGVYEFTITDRSASSGNDIFGMAVSTDASNDVIASFSYVSRTQFTVRTRGGGGSLANHPFAVDFKW